MRRLTFSMSGYADPVRRPRWVIWTVVSLIMLIGIMVPVLGITSTRWFCANACHKVQDDTIKAYQHSSHSEISCMACHMPVNATPIVFMLHKMEALGELAMTVTNNYELPLNAESEVSLTMKSGQCTQCHSPETRKMTFSKGMRMNHPIHAEKGVQCSYCHNRIAHNEDFELKGIDPKTKEPNKKHENFMQMTACFRCHSQERGKDLPPGDCSVCHSPKFRSLIPESHRAKNFFPAGHGKLGLAEEKRAPWMNATDTVSPEAKAEDKAKKETLGQSLPTVESINLCSTCHAKNFCLDCHGVPMPHPDKERWNKEHAAFGRANPESCAKCHGLGVDFCNNCHHGQTIGYKIKPKVTWKVQHPLAVAKIGPAGCIQPGGCHSPTYCALCHANGGTLPKKAPAY